MYTKVIKKPGKQGRVRVSYLAAFVIETGETSLEVIPTAEGFLDSNKWSCQIRSHTKALQSEKCTKCRKKDKVSAER